MVDAGADVGELLGAAFPELAVASVEPLGEGWDHVAYLVNGDLVFRLPWELVEGTGPVEPGRAAPELALLRAVAGRVPVEVPQPAFVAPDGTYFGYRYLPGASLDERLDEWRAPGRRAALVDLIVDVSLAVERAVPVTGAATLGLPVVATNPYDAAPVRAGMASPLVSAAGRSAGEWALGVAPARWEAAAARRTVTLHADLGLDHWLLDERGEVYALIDWSDACVGPPEHQVASLMWHVPELVAAVSAAHTERTGAALDGELIVADGLLNALGDLGELLDEGTAEDDEDVRTCLAFLDTWADRREP